MGVIDWIIGVGLLWSLILVVVMLGFGIYGWIDYKIAVFLDRRDAK